MGLAVAVFFGVTFLAVVPAAFVGAKISCWGVDTTEDLFPARYCGFGARSSRWRRCFSVATHPTRLPTKRAGIAGHCDQIALDGRGFR